jgi:glutathione S-transferase
MSIAVVLARTLLYTSPLAGIAYAESTYISPALSHQLFGLVILSNVIGSSFALIVLGTRVGRARKEYDVPLPVMYADASHGENGVKFNNVQRGHQNALETYSSYLALSLVSGLRFPVVTALLGVLYIAARIAWADGYRNGGAEARYTYSMLGRHVFTPLVVMCIASLFFSYELLSGARKLI